MASRPSASSACFERLPGVRKGPRPAEPVPAAPLSDSSLAQRGLSQPVAVTEDCARQAIRLSFLIHDVSRMRRTAYDQLMRPLGVTRAQWWVLAHLSRHDGIMQTQLADALDVGKASLGTLLDRLEAGGFIERRDDPADRRAKHIYMARSGQRLLERMTHEENRFNERILGGLSATDRETMIKTLTAIKQALSSHIAHVD